MRNHPSGARKGTAQRLGPEDSSYVEQGNVTNLASDNLWLSHLGEGPDYKDHVRYMPGEIARGLLPVVEEEPSSLNQAQAQSDSIKTSSRNKDFSPSSGKEDASWVSFSDPVWVSLTPTALRPSFEMAQPVDLEDSDFEDHTSPKKPRLEEGPDYKDQVRYKPGEITRGLLPVVKEEEPSSLNQAQAQSESIKPSSRNKFSPSSGKKDVSDPVWVSLTPTTLTPSFEMDHTTANKPRLEDGPDFKDQVRYLPGEISRCVLPIVKEGPLSMDQAQPQSNRLMGTLGSNPDNDLRNQIVTGKGDAGHQDSSTELDIENNDATGHQDPSLVNAVLVDNTTIVKAIQVVESKTLKNIIWLFALVVVAAGGLTLILLLLQKPPPEPPTQEECENDSDCVDVSKYICESNKCVLRGCEIGINAECCNDADCDSGYRCASYYCVKKGNPSFSLTWFGDDDLDLHVLTPGGVEIYFYYEDYEDYTFDPVSGGELDHDDIPLEDAGADNPIQNWVENVNFPLVGSPEGTYTFWVHNYDQVGNGAEPWELTSFIDDTVENVYRGVLAHDEESERFTLTR